nr:uncharacterized protein LOC109181117 [Ipomoea batatas]
MTQATVDHKPRHLAEGCVPEVIEVSSREENDSEDDLVELRELLSSRFSSDFELQETTVDIVRRIRNHGNRTRLRHQAELGVHYGDLLAPSTDLRWSVDLPPSISLIRGDVPSETVMRSLLLPHDLDLCRCRHNFSLILESFVHYGAMGDALVTTQAQLKAETRVHLESYSKLEAKGVQYDQLAASHAREKKALEEAHTHEREFGKDLASAVQHYRNSKHVIYSALHRKDETFDLNAWGLPTELVNLEASAKVHPSSPCASRTRLATDVGLLPDLTLGFGTAAYVPLDQIHILEGMINFIQATDVEARDP